jgi:DNA helicase-2/ATP-dependent DNA helicase PcrA
MADLSFLSDLNTRQLEAVKSTEGRIRVIAGAGTGKTKALTCRYAYLVNVLGIDPANILCLTFTNKAASEMRIRIANMVHSGDYNDFVCTIDGFCVKLLRKEIYRLGFPKSFTIIDEEDQKEVAKACMDDLGIKRTEKTVKQFLTGISVKKESPEYISTFMTPGVKFSDEMLKSEFASYIYRQMKNYALDFDDIENFTKYILSHFDDAREYWQNQLNYIMVDEAQDCNDDNWEIIETLAGKHHNLFAVGDPDQCIYEWRGAKPSRFIDFPRDKDIVLDENYRSTPNVLDVANSVIANNKMRVPKELFTRKAEGKAVIHFHGKSESEEMRWVARQISSLLAAGASPHDFAILYRSSYQSRPIEQELIRSHILYTVWGGTRFFERREIKDALSYLRLVNNPADDISFMRVLNRPSRKLGKAFVDKLKSLSSTTGGSLYETLRDNLNLQGLGREGAIAFVKIIEDGRKAVEEGTSISDLLNKMLDTSGLKDELRQDQDEERLENIEELLTSVKFYEKSHREDYITLNDYLQEIALYTNADYKADTPSVKLMTIHQAKGLEFPFVFVIGLSEGIFPNMRSLRDRKKQGEEDERRLMYVAVTRAEKALFLTESEGYNSSTKMSKYPSRFLAEIKKNMLVTEGKIPDELWKGTMNLVHVLDQELYGNPFAGSDGQGLSDGSGDFSAELAAYESPFQIGDTVIHDIFGEGVVIGANKEYTTFEVQFKDGSVRSIRAPFLRLPDLPE